jgi:hypothetical protein
MGDRMRVMLVFVGIAGAIGIDENYGDDVRFWFYFLLKTTLKFLKGGY